MELKVEKKRYKCTNFGSCSLANSGEIIELLASEKPECPEDQFPLTPLDEDRPRWKQVLAEHKPIVAALAAVVLLVPLAIFGYRWYGARPHGSEEVTISATKRQVAPSLAEATGGGAPSSPGAQDGAMGGMLTYPASDLADSAKREADALKGKGGDAAVEEAKRTAAKSLNNSAVGLMQKNELDRADEQLAKAISEYPGDTLAYLNRAIIRARQQRKDDALANVDEAFKRGFREVSLLEKDKDFAVVRSIPGYSALLEKYGLAKSK